jgi:hypothetical protein
MGCKRKAQGEQHRSRADHPTEFLLESRSNIVADNDYRGEYARHGERGQARFKGIPGTEERVHGTQPAQGGEDVERDKGNRIARRLMLRFRPCWP